MEEQQATSISSDESAVMPKKAVLLVDEKKDKGETVEPDERFFLDEEIVEEPEQNNKKVFNNELKKKMKQEERKAKIQILKSKLKSPLSSSTFLQSIMRVLDYFLNLFSIACIVAGMLLSIDYIIKGNPWMVLAGCAFVFTGIYLNEKIN